MSNAIYPKRKYSEIIPNKQSTNHNSVLGGIHEMYDLKYEINK